MLARIKTRHSRRRSRAASILELAITLPLFTLITFGIFEFGRAMMVQQIVTNCAREGARRAVTAGATDATTQATIDSYMAIHSITGFSRIIAPSVAATASGDPITVTVSVPYSAVAWGVMPFLNDNTLSATVTMRKE